MNHGRLHGKRCLITGAARGIGAELAASVVRAGGKALYQNCDVTQPSKVSAAVDAAVQFLGGIDVRFNNAGPATPRNNLVP